MPSITVTFKVQETVTTEVTATIEVDDEAEAAELLADHDALMGYLGDNDEAWVDGIDPSQQQVEDRDVIEIVSAEEAEEDDE